MYLFPASRINQLNTSLRSLFDNFNNRYRYPVFLFHDEDCKAQAMSELRTSLTPQQMCLLRFYHITHRFPPGFNDTEALRTGVVWQFYFPGYPHMISFWWKWVFEHPKVRELDYFMRLDTDSIINSPIHIDLFDVMKSGGFSYGYRHTMVDPDWVVKGLWEYYREYATRTLGLMPRAMKSRSPRLLQKAHAPMYYTNFEIVFVPFFTQRNDVKAFIDEVYASHYIYMRRWGDAPLRYFLINTFLNASKDVRQFCEVNYTHYPILCHQGCACKKVA